MDIDEELDNQIKTMNLEKEEQERIKRSEMQDKSP